MKKLTPLILLLTFTLPFSLQAKVDLIYDKKGVAIEGYDVVSYIQNNKAQKGSKKFQTTHDETKYYFASNDNKNSFIQSPEKYLPAYGGWCAWAMAEYNDFVEVDPKSFIIAENDKGQKQTFLFYNGWLGNTLKKWKKKVTGASAKNTQEKQLSLIKKGNNNWEQHTKKTHK